MNDFLNAKSTVTPGVAGGLVMLIANTGASQFDLAPKWTALVVSGIFGLLLVCILVAPLWQKGLLWILNALIIFSMAMGTNQAGASLQKQPDTKYGVGPYPTPAMSPSPSPAASTSPTPAQSPSPSPEINPSVSPGASRAPSISAPARAAAEAFRKKTFFRSWR